MTENGQKTAENAKIPGHLRTITKKWFRQVSSEYVLESHHIKLLTLAAEAWERSQDCQELLTREGLTFTDRFGCPHLRPEVKAKETAETNFARLIRELNLDVEPPRGGRPPSLY